MLKMLDLHTCQYFSGTPPSSSRLVLMDRFLRLLGVDLGGAGEQLVPAHHALAQVNFVQPHVGLADQGLLHKLAAVGNQEQLGRQQRDRMSHTVFFYASKLVQWMLCSNGLQGAHKCLLKYMKRRAKQCLLQ